MRTSINDRMTPSCDLNVKLPKNPQKTKYSTRYLSIIVSRISESPSRTGRFLLHATPRALFHQLCFHIDNISRLFPRKRKAANKCTYIALIQRMKLTRVNSKAEDGTRLST